MSTTEKNLMEAFAGESQANRKYLAFAIQADKEGYPQVAKLFRAAAEARSVIAILVDGSNRWQARRGRIGVERDDVKR